MTVTDVDRDRLRALVAELDTLLSPGVSPATVNPDGTPGLVAAGELIEAAWGNAVANTITGLPRGQLTKATKVSDQGGFGAGELDIGVVVTVPATPTGRTHTIAFAVRIVQTTAPPADSIVYVNVRTGSAAGALVESFPFPFVANASVNGRTLAGEIVPTALTPGQGYSLTIGSDGTGRFTVRGGVSWAALYDVT